MHTRTRPNLYPTDQTRDQHQASIELSSLMMLVCRPRRGHMTSLLWHFVVLPFVHAMVVTKLEGANHSALTHLSSGGGTHVYISGTDLGSAFAPPAVYLGMRAGVECKVQPFSSTKNRLHCIVSADGAPAPTPIYKASGEFVILPIQVVKSNGRIADCWYSGGVNFGCFAQFDIGGTPRVLRVLNTVAESGGVLRLSGHGINGGLSGTPALTGTLFRGATPVLGSCGEKDCQASTLGAETLGCSSRPDAGGDGVSSAQESQMAVAFSDATRYGCKLEEVAGGLTGGFFNLSLHLNRDPLHRGDAYLGFLATRLIDVANGVPFDAEVLPRITAIQPQRGSLASGADVTVSGTGARVPVSFRKPSRLWSPMLTCCRLVQTACRLWLRPGRPQHPRCWR